MFSENGLHMHNEMDCHMQTQILHLLQVLRKNSSLGNKNKINMKKTGKREMPDLFSVHILQPARLLIHGLIKVLI